MGAPSRPGFKLGQTFFGFKPEHRPKLHDQLFELLWVGEGRWDWNTLYTMPIFLRTFWIRKLNNIADKRMAMIEKSKQKPSTSKVIKPPM